MTGIFFGIILGLAAVILAAWLVMERRLRPHPSTRSFWKLSRLPWFKKAEGYFYGARPHLYLKPATWSWFVKGHPESADSYHGKVITVSDAACLVSLKEPIELRQQEHIIPYPLASDIIINNPESLAVMRCPCREQKPDACVPREVCMVVGEPFASFVVEHQTGNARFIELNEALDILRSEDERGHIHTAWFKDAMHNRFYAICNCCTCCCLGMKSYQRGTPRLCHSGYQPRLDMELCSNCWCCVDICPFSAVSDAEPHPLIDQEACMGCGLCVSHCPHQALTLEQAPHRGAPLKVDRILE